MLRPCGTVIGTVSPDTVLTKICIVSGASGEADREDEGVECILRVEDWVEESRERSARQMRLSCDSVDKRRR